MKSRRHRRHKLKWPSAKFLKKKAWRLIGHPVFVVLTICGNLLIALGAFGLYITERGINRNVNTILDTIWWAVATVTTVGYGDVSPVTPAGKIIGIVLMILGTAMFWSYTALFADTLMSDEFEDFEDELRNIEIKLSHLKTEDAHRSGEAHEVLGKIERHLNDLKLISTDATTIVSNNARS